MKYLLLITLIFCCGTAYAAEARRGEIGQSGLPLPRFASLRSSEANLRTGPGLRYPIDWVLIYKGMPLEITAEYDVWRKVRDFEGAEGWVHKSSLSGKRTAVVTGTVREMRQKDKEQSPVLARIEPGAVGQLLSCAAEWCRVKFGGIKGYLRKGEFWGVYEKEEFD